MAEYTIFVLDESDLTLSDTGLDGVTQGDGSHMDGQTLVINNPNWTGIRITDNDVTFSDNDGSQRLDGAQEIDGVIYENGTRLEAEFSFEVSYGGETWVVLGFNVRNSSPAYGTVEGIAVIGDQGGFPPAGVELQVSNGREFPTFPVSDFATPICFDAGSLILTPRGYVPVDDLRAGDLVETLDDGAQPVLWMGSRRAFGVGAFAPVEIDAGALGNRERIRVSQQHRILLDGPWVELMFGEPEVLAPARALLGRSGVRLVEGCSVHYHHLLLEKHGVLDCAGLKAESFLPCGYGLTQITEMSRLSLRAAMPDVERRQWPAARTILKGYEAELLAAA